MDSTLKIALAAIEGREVGPRGGNLDGPVNRTARNANLEGLKTEDGLLTLHRFERQDAAYAGIKNEQPWHRMAAYMLLAGRTNSEIAMAAERSTAQVTVLRGQKWFQQLLANLANEAGGDVMGVLAGEALASIETIVSLRDDSDMPARVRLSAAQTLLEQAHGKPVQKILSHTQHSSADPTQEMQDILSELQALKNK